MSGNGEVIIYLTIFIKKVKSSNAAV